MKRFLFVSVFFSCCLNLFAQVGAYDDFAYADQEDGYFGVDLGFGFDANDSYSKMPFVMDTMVGTELLWSGRFFFGCYMGYNYLSMNDSGDGYKSRYNEHIIRWFIPLGFACGKSYGDFNFRIGPTMDLLVGMKSVMEIGKEKYVTRLRDMDPEPELLSFGLRMGVTVADFLEVTYQVGLTNHMENGTKHQVTFGFPIKFVRY